MHIRNGAINDRGLDWDVEQGNYRGRKIVVGTFRSLFVLTS